MADAEALHSRLQTLKLDLDIDRLQEACHEIEHRGDGARYLPDLFAIMEANPEFDFGVPGAIVHTIETFRGKYEGYLFASLRRSPTSHTVWMLNRIINLSSGAALVDNLDLMHAISCDANANADARESAKEFLDYQRGKYPDENEEDEP